MGGRAASQISEASSKNEKPRSVDAHCNETVFCQISLGKERRVTGMYRCCECGAYLDKPNEEHECEAPKRPQKPRRKARRYVFGRSAPKTAGNSLRASKNSMARV